MGTEDHSCHSEDDRKKVKEDIEAYGCHIVLIETDGYLPAFAYTIGLYENYGRPEIIVFGLKTELMGILLNHAQDLLRDNGVLLPNILYEGFIDGYPIQFLEVKDEHFPDYFGYGGWYRGNFDYPALQLVWPDKESKWPWEEGFDERWTRKQKLLDRDTGFKFYEAKDLAVFTTKQFLEGEPILFVYHNEDGDWQFHCSESPDLGEAAIVCLEQVLRRDPSLNSIYYLGYGKRAARKSIEADWEIEDVSDEDEEMPVEKEINEKKGLWTRLFGKK